MKLCGLIFKGTTQFFFYSKTHQIFYISLFWNNFDNRQGNLIICIPGQNGHNYISILLWMQFFLTYYLLIFWLFFRYFFFHFLCKGILSLSFINYRFIYMFTQARQTSQLTVLSLKNENIIIGIVWSWGIGLLCIAFQVN